MIFECISFYVFFLCVFLLRISFVHYFCVLILYIFYYVFFFVSLARVAFSVMLLALFLYCGVLCVLSRSSVCISLCFALILRLLYLCFSSC